MSVDRLVIVGGGPAALSAARGYRDAGGAGDVTLLTPELDLPYNRPPLSKDHLRGETSEAELALEPPDWYAEHRVEVRLGERAVALDSGARAVSLASGDRLHYDACVLATGSLPTRLPVPGADHDDVLLLRSLASGRALRERAERARRATVIGSGFIGCEAAASLALRGLDVTLVSDEAIPHARRLGEDAGRRIATWLDEQGVGLRLGAEVEAIDGGRRVHVAGGDPLDADLVLMAAGVRPAGELAEGAGLPTHAGHAVVDARMRAGVDGVLACGDMAWAYNEAAGRHVAVEHWGDALTMGELAGRSAAGADGAWASAPGFWSTIGDRTLKYAAWGDGHDEARLVEHPGGGWTVWYGRDGITVGVLTHEADADYERGTEMVERGAKLP